MMENLRTAIGAIDKGIIEPVRLMFQIIEAVGAYGNIGTDLRSVIRKILAGQDPEILQVFREVIVNRDLVNLSCNRGLISEIFNKNRQRCPLLPQFLS